METSGKGMMLFVAGGLVGAGIALLTAPQSGRKTRRDLVYLGDKVKNQADRMKLDLVHGIDGMSEKLHSTVDHGRQWAGETLQGVWSTLGGKNRNAEMNEKMMHS